MSNVLEIPDAGMVRVTVGGGEVTLDAFCVHNELCEARQQNADADGGVRGFHALAAEVLARHGLPALNHFQVDRFVTALQGAVEQLGKV